MKKFTSILLTFVLLAINVPFAAQASPLDDNKFEFNIVPDEVRLVDVDLSNAKKDIEKLQTELATNEDSIKSIQSEIDTTQTKVNSINKDLKQSEQTLSQRLREMYKAGGYPGFNYISFLVRSSSISDLFERVNSCELLIKQDNTLINVLHEKATELTESMNSISKKKEDLVSVNQTIQQKINDIKTQEAIAAETKAKLDAERARIADQVRQNEENLIAHSVSVINTTTSSVKDITDAVNNLKGLLPQLTTASVKQTANAAIAKGTSKISGTATPNGAPTSYKQTLSVQATAYTANSLTATGTTPVRNPNGISTIAVDPKVIPLGCKVYVTGYGYAVAADTGGAIKGNIIDVFLNSNQDCINWGRKNVTVYIVAYKGEW